jgi:hypothetical protein
MAVDSSNHPRLMWESRAPGGAVTGFFHSSECNGGCTTKANWHEAAIVTFETSQFSLEFTAVNQPRVHAMNGTNSPPG